MQGISQRAPLQQGWHCPSKNASWSWQIGICRWCHFRTQSIINTSHFLNNKINYLNLKKGRNVVLESKYGSPKIVNDGVTVAKEVELEDPVENIGAKLVIQAASKTNDLAGENFILENL